MSYKLFSKSLLPFFFIAVNALAMEPIDHPAVKKQTYLSLISTDNRRFWIAPENVAHFSKLHAFYEKLDDTKFLKTDLEGNTLHLLKDLIDAECEKKDLKEVIAKHQHITLAQYAALTRESIKLQLPIITRTIEKHMYDAQSEFTPKEFESLGAIDFAYYKLCAIQTNDKVFILPEAIASTCPYLASMLSSSFKESQERILKLPANHTTDTIRFIKQIIECKHGKDFAHFKPQLIQMAQEFQSLSIDAIGIADQWLMPEVAHVLAQVLLQKKPETISDLPKYLDKYVPPFKAEDAMRLKECALSYLEWIADAHENKFFEASQEALARKLIASIAENIDDYIEIPSALALFKQPKMRVMTALLNAQLAEKKKIKEEAPIVIQPYSDPVCPMQLTKLSSDKFIVTSPDENPKIYSNAGKHLYTLKGGFFEKFESVVAYPRRDIILTASYRNTIKMLAYDPLLYLKVWNGSGTCLRTKTCYAYGHPNVTLQLLNYKKTLVKLGDRNILWQYDRGTDQLLESDIAPSTHVAPLDFDKGLVALCTQDNPDTHTLGILDLENNTQTTLKRARGTCQRLSKLDDSHILLTPTDGKLEIWNTDTGMCQNTIDRATIPGMHIISKIDDYLLLIGNKCAFIYDDKKNITIKNLTDQSTAWHTEHSFLSGAHHNSRGPRETTTNALALDPTHVAMATITPDSNKIIIKQFNDLLPIEETIRKRQEQLQREQSLCPVM